jgi:paraquat-inducible protein A
VAVVTDQIICETCDAVYRKPSLDKGEKAHCRRCGALLTRYGRLQIDRWLALSITAGIVLLFANIYPIMRISMQGLSNSATLLESALGLASGPIIVMALTAAFTIILVPTLQVGMLIWLLGFARAGRRAPGFVVCMRALETLRPWSMLEVGLLGALVAVVKLSGLLDVLPGIGLAALALLTVMVLRLAGRDIRQLWERV